MRGLTVALLDRACRIFLHRAYPEGPHTVPAPKARYLSLDPAEPIEAVLTPPVCEVLRVPGGGLRGYALRLGCTGFPHLKLQVVAQGEAWVFAVDTHDQIKLDPGHPDAPGWRQLQANNRRLKEEIERDWEADGLLTLNALLRQALERPAKPSPPTS
jgi:hypothetical protein